MSPTRAPAPAVDAGSDRPLDASPHRANEHPLTALSKLLASKRAAPKGVAVRPSSARGAAITWSNHTNPTPNPNP
eukprot:scaffold49015_cov33-Phaeocystis_antarctica.AAC.1